MSFLKNIFCKDKDKNQLNTDANILISKSINSNNVYATLILWWISQKKDGYNIVEHKFPKWFFNDYKINFDLETKNFLDKGFLQYNDSNSIILTEKGKQELAYYNCIVIMKTHPEYDMKLSDFSLHKQWHIIKDNDIVWGKLNSRIIEYTKNKLWDNLESTYSAIASLLIEETKYQEALPFIFASSFLETSGMHNDNKLSPLCEYKNTDVPFVEINNFNVTALLQKINKALNLNENDLFEKYVSSKIVLSLIDILPFYYYDLTEAFKFMFEALNRGETNGIFTIYILNKQLKYNKPNMKETKKYFYNSTENQIRAYH